MDEKTSPETVRTGAPHALRRLGQAIASLDEETPRIDVGDQAKIKTVEAQLATALPDELRQTYTDSNPVSVAVPMPDDDIEFWAVEDLVENNRAANLPDRMIGFASAGPTVYAVRAGGDTAVLAGRSSGPEWDWEEAASSLGDFISALAVIVEAFASGEGDLASRLELDAQRELTLEEELSAIDPGRVEQWLEWLA